MGKELLLVAEALSNEKGVRKEIVLEAIQSALESAARKFSGKDIGVRIQLDPRTGEYDSFQYWDIVADGALEYIDNQMEISKAREYLATIEVGQRLEQPMLSVEFGRIAAQSARQVIMQKVRDAERQQVIEQYDKKIGQLMNGIVKKITRDNVLLDFGGKAEAFLPRSEMLPNETFRVNDRVRVCLMGISNQFRGPQLLVSRTNNEMLIELFGLEVPEINENIIEVKAAARDPGNRAKIAVKTNDGRIDPVGACVGMRGARVQAVSNELGGERVDIVLWDDNPAQFVINAMAPAEITSIVVDEDSHTMDLAVQKEFLSQAIGRNGQNVRLASQLSGWVLNVMTVEDFNNKGQEESNKISALFVNTLGVDEDIANLLINSGFSSIEEIAYVPIEELLVIEDFDDKIVEILRNKANDVLLTQALVLDEIAGLSKHDAYAELMTLQGMTDALAKHFVANGIMTIENLAEQSVDDLLEIPGITEKQAGELIMKAREPWFK